MRQEQISAAPALGPDGKEWAKTQAGYTHVSSMVARADGLSGGAPWWHGWALREAFVAGAEWQQARKPSESAQESAVELLTAELTSSRLIGVEEGLNLAAHIVREIGAKAANSNRPLAKQQCDVIADALCCAAEQVGEDTGQPAGGRTVELS